MKNNWRVYVTFVSENTNVNSVQHKTSGSNLFKTILAMADKTAHDQATYLLLNEAQNKISGKPNVKLVTVLSDDKLTVVEIFR